MSTGKSSRNRQRIASPEGVALESPLSAALLKTVDLGLGAVVFVAPYLLGGRHPLGHFVIMACCVATAIAWFARQLISTNPTWTHFSAWIVPSLAALVVVLQLVPIPAEWMPTLTPRLQEILPLWSGAEGNGLGSWRTLSLAPEETRLALATLVAYGLLFVTAVQRLESTADILRLMRMIGLSAVGVACFGVVQYFSSNGKFFWFYENPFTNTSSILKAGFTCRNHFAHFLVLGLAMLLAWVMLKRHSQSTPSPASRPHGGKSDQHWRVSHDSTGVATWLLVALLVLVACTILASLSRGGILAMATVVLVSTASYARARLLTTNHWAIGGLLMVLAMAALSLSGKYTDVSNRLDDFVSQDIRELDSLVNRQAIWSANLSAIRAGWLTGSGAGTHRFIYPIYLAEPSNVEYTHAENGYLQIATENGLPGMLLLGATIILCAYWVISTQRNARGNTQVQIMNGGLAAALAASVVHSLVDFVWFIPACIATTILLIAALLRLHQLITPARRPRGGRCQLTPLTRFNLALGVTLSGVWAISILLAPAKTALEWDSYLRASLANQRSSDAARQRMSLAESEDVNKSSMLEHLTNVVREYPQSARAQSRLAGNLLTSFEDLQRGSDNAMPISQIRDAALASKFQSGQQLRNWLRQAFGEHIQLLYQAHYHASRALELCPLQGEAYLCLAELSFLEGSSPAAYQRYAQQGIQVSPCDCELLFGVGKNQLLVGHQAEAIRLWAKAFRGSGKHRLHVARLSATWMTASEFLEAYQPKWDALETVWSVYKESSSSADREALLAYANHQVEVAMPTMTPTAAGKAWLVLARMQKELSGQHVALQSLEQAYLLDPNSFSIRYELGKCLLSLDQFTPAESHLRWCFDHYPENATIRNDLQKAIRGSMQQLARTTQTTVR